MKTLSIFGATGSVGSTTLAVVAAARDRFQVDVVSADKNVQGLAKIARDFRAAVAVIGDASVADELTAALADTDTVVLAGRDGLIQAANRPVDCMMSAIVGFAGLEISLAGAEHAKVLALANKESLVCAGPLLRETCAKHGTKLLPVDSEHSAIFQCLVGEDPSHIERVILTASGGPFRHTSREQMRTATPSIAADHPNWDMGQRISIDSASMFNKAMEVIEAKELFDLKPNQIEVIIHPQSIVHSMVGFTDGSIKAQMGPADMTGAVGYALNYPDRAALAQDRLDFTTLGTLDFEPVDAARFPAIDLAFRAMRAGGFAGAVFNAAKEQALDLFLAQKIGFLDMAGHVEAALSHYMDSQTPAEVTLGALKRVDQDTRDFVVALDVSGGVHV